MNNPNDTNDIGIQVQQVLQPGETAPVAQPSQAERRARRDAWLLEHAKMLRGRVNVGGSTPEQRTSLLTIELALDLQSEIADMRHRVLSVEPGRDGHTKAIAAELFESRRELAEMRAQLGELRAELTALGDKGASK